MTDKSCLKKAPLGSGAFRTAQVRWLWDSWYSCRSSCVGTRGIQDPTTLPKTGRSRKREKLERGMEGRCGRKPEGVIPTGKQPGTGVERAQFPMGWWKGFLKETSVVGIRKRGRGTSHHQIKISSRREAENLWGNGKRTLELAGGTKRGGSFSPWQSLPSG